jgi:hypothetical protein
VTHTFTLVLGGPDPTAPENIDRFFEAGCDDALFFVRDGLHFAEFEREAPTYLDALKTAICAIEGAVPGLLVNRVESPNERTAVAKAFASCSWAHAVKSRFLVPWPGCRIGPASGIGMKFPLTSQMTSRQLHRRKPNISQTLSSASETRSPSRPY